MIPSVISLFLIIIFVDIETGVSNRTAVILSSHMCLLSPLLSGSGDGGHSVTEQ